jgi:hypothetical protein
MFWRPRFLKNQKGLPGFLMFDPKRNTVSYMFLRLWDSQKPKIWHWDSMFVCCSTLKIHDVRAHVCVRLDQVALLEYKYFPISRAVCSSPHSICTSVFPKRKRQRRMFGAPVSALWKCDFGYHMFAALDRGTFKITSHNNYVSLVRFSLCENSSVQRYGVCVLSRRRLWSMNLTWAPGLQVSSTSHLFAHLFILKIPRVPFHAVCFSLS